MHRFVIPQRRYELNRFLLKSNPRDETLDYPIRKTHYIMKQRRFPDYQQLGGELIHRSLRIIFRASGFQTGGW